MSFAKRAPRGWMIAPVLACSVIMGCNDDDGDDNARGDGGPSIDAGGGMDGSTSTDGGIPDGGKDAGSLPGFTGAVAKPAPLSTDVADLDRLYATVFGADGKIYAAGYVQKTVGGLADRQIAVARFGTDGNLDPSWGTGGVVLHNLKVATAGAPDTAETARGIGITSDNKIVITGTVPGAKVGELDNVDVFVARLSSVGALDTTFSAADADGVAGAAILDLSAPAQRTNMTTNAVSTINDEAYGLAIDGLDRTVVFARAKAEGESRTDWDRYVLRFTTGGELDSSFAGDGKYSYDIQGGDKWDDNARNGRILPGNKILSVGYTNIDGKNTIGLLRLNENGTEDTTFDGDGKVTINPLAPQGLAEAYGVAVQSNGSYVTVGYGNEGTPPQKVVSFRFASNGARDTTYGVAGNLLFDLQADADQGRNIVALSDDRLLAVGNSNTAMGVGDGLALMISKDGQVTHAQAIDFGRTGEQLLGLALSADGTYAAAVGYSSGGMSGPDDGAIWVYRLKP